MNANLAARLAGRAAAHPDRTALVAGRGRRRRALSYAELNARVLRVATALAARGVRPGDRVLLFVPMSIELYVALLGTLAAGAVAVFVDAWADRRRLDAAVAAARPVAFVGSPRAQLLRLVSPAVRAIPRAVWVRRGFGSRAAAGAAAPALAAAVEAGPDAPALVTFTTGTTGTPRAAARSHGFLWAQHEALARELGTREGDVDLPTLPVFALHDLATGCTCVLPGFDPRRPGAVDARALVAQLREEGVTTAVASPSFFEALLAPPAPPGALRGLRALFTGGAPVPPGLVRRLAALEGTDARALYGSTEVEPIAAIAALDLARTLGDPGGGLCAGRPVEGLALRIVRAHDGPIELDARGWAAWDAPALGVGEIVVSGAHVLAGYLDDPASDRRHKVKDGARTWHRTGDAGRLDANGTLWLLGRVNQRLTRGGATAWPLPIELAALAVEGVRHAAWVVVRERGVLCVETAGGALAPALATAVREAAAQVAPFPPDEVRALERIPRDPRHASKTDAGALLARLGAGET